jgi:hypothetical protein
LYSHAAAWHAKGNAIGRRADLTVRVIALHRFRSNARAGWDRPVPVSLRRAPTSIRFRSFRARPGDRKPRRIGVFLAVTLAAIVAPANKSRAGRAPVTMRTPRIRQAAGPGDTAEISFVGHARFEIVLTAGVLAVTSFHGIDIRLSL